MRKEFESNEIKFKKYDPVKKEHIEFVEEFGQDELNNEFFEGWEGMIRDSLRNTGDTIYAYIVEVDGNTAGLCTICFIDDHSAVFSQGILPKYRGQNYAGRVRQAIMDYMKTVGVYTLVGYLRLENDNIIRNLSKQGFSIQKVGNTPYYEVRYYEQEFEYEEDEPERKM